MSQYCVEEIRPKIIDCFQKAGLSPGDAIELCEQLLYAEMRGIESHGLVRIQWILNQIHKYPNPKVKEIIVKDNCELYDADGVLGYLALSQITNRQKNAFGQTMRMIGIQNTYPTGALAYFAEKIAEKGWLVLMSSTSPRRVGLAGDSMPLVGTNPWTFGLPVKTPLGGYVVADTSLAELTHGQCLKLLSTGQALPQVVASLPGGKEITSPKDFYKDEKWNALIHPIGGRKAYKSFCIMWSLHILGLRMLGISSEGKYGTFMLLLSPDMWSPAISKDEIINGLTQEIDIVQQSTVAQVPSLDRVKRLLEAGNKIEISDDIAGIIL
jgi:LDH2 family malate/lactate/ureidoglycolate dehydrogenase